MLGSGQGCSWGTGECISGAWGCFGVFSGVLGLFEGVGGLRGVSGSLLPSFPFNVRKSQMRILNFFSRPEDPKCLKYQNVPNLGSFWAIGKPWERFQSWDIRIYFISVPKDHTVSQRNHAYFRIAVGKVLDLYYYWSLVRDLFSCPGQLNRWPCHWLTHSDNYWQCHLLSCPGQLKTHL